MTDNLVQLAQVLKQNSLRKLQQNFFLPQIDSHKKPPLSAVVRKINTAGEIKRPKFLRDNERTESEEQRAPETHEGSRKALRDGSLNSIKRNNEEILSQKSETIIRFLPETKEKLRQAFIESAMSYTGVPYSKKSLKPEERTSNKAMKFLDCCGLIRQAVYDNRELFGFQLLKWNQAYQHDTLPINLKPEEMKPGDLIFYTGIYFDKKKKRHAHDLVHVEVFLGGETGEKTVASRLREGVVQTYDSYKFSSTNYYSIRHIFKSIDTWLEGTCKSFCKRHQWKEDFPEMMKKKRALRQERLRKAKALKQEAES